MEFWDYCTHIYSLMKGKALKRGTFSQKNFSPDELKGLPQSGNNSKIAKIPGRFTSSFSCNLRTVLPWRDLLTSQP